MEWLKIMKIIKKTNEYSIFKKRNDRYAIKDSNGEWLNAEKKVAILKDEELIKLSESAKPEPEEINEAEATETTETTEATEATETTETTENEESKKE